VGLGADVELLGGDTELKSTPGILVADPLGLSHHTAGDRSVLSSNSLVSPHYCKHTAYYCRDQKYNQCGDTTASQPHSVAVLANVLTDQFILETNES
jgi:hypothetical protein